MRGVSTIALFILVGCSGDQGAGTTAQTTATTTATPTVTAPRTSGTSQLAAGADPWLALARALGGVQDGALAEQMSSRLADRKKQRDVEETQIKRSMVAASGALAGGCNTEKGIRAFADLQAVEMGSLERDRATLADLLTMAGGEGRKTLWEAGEIGTTILTSRQKVAQDLASSLPSKLTSETNDADVEARRVLVSLKFAIEAVDLDTQAALSAAKNDIEDMDPASDDVVAAVAATLQRVDDALLAAQKTKFERLLEVCGMVSPDSWLTMLESGAISTYIGRVGGQGGIQSASQQSRSGQMGSGQMGSGQMGSQQMGGQMGGQQMGGGQMGGQMGGQQMGSGQMGSGQMGGGQMGGGQMGGGQMGGGQMGGGQMGGGQMGGGQMGGGQMGGGQMGGQMGQQQGSQSGQLR